MISNNLEETLHKALNVAREFHHEYATVEHLLLAILEDSDVRPIVEKYCTNIFELERKIQNFLYSELSSLTIYNVTEVQPTAAFQKILHRAAMSAQAANKHQFSSLDVFLELLREQDSYASMMLKENNITYDIVMQAMKDQENANKRNGNRTDTVYKEYIFSKKPKATVNVIKKETYKGESGKAALGKYCTNINVMAKEGRIDMLVGRHHEVDRLIEILLKRTKNNPILVGEPGVGKTAIVEGLALRIVNKEVPASFRNAIIYSLNMGGVLAGTRYRGDFEERLRDVIDEVEKNENSILFIDEIHTIIGAGVTNSGSLDAGNLLKPALARGKFRCIGATTFKEYNTHFEKDRALMRRFEVVAIDEPDSPQTLKIVRGLKAYYEKHHNVTYSSSAINASVVLADRYIKNKFMPDKAIDIIDEAGAAKSLSSPNKHSTITSKDIERTVSKMAKVSLSKLTMTDADKLHDLDRNLKKVIFGQDKAVDELVSAFKLSKAGLRKHDRPMGCYIFSGPTGVGKTELAKQFADLMSMELIRFDMSEYMEQHSVSKLIGTPPGYVGFDQGGFLTDAVSKNPYSVVLLDEIEKANRDIYNLLLQIMDYGHITDNNGRSIHFYNTIIIMTSNLGAEEMSKYGLGFSHSHQQGDEKEAIKKFFTPEFLNRLDTIISFAPLSEDNIVKVAHKYMNEFALQLSEKDITLKFSAKILPQIAIDGMKANMGARPIERLIQDQIKKPIADEMLFGSLRRGGVVEVKLDSKGGYLFNYVKCKEKILV